MPVAVRTVSLLIPLLAAVVGLVAVVEPILAVVLALAIVFGTLTLVDLRVGVCVYAFSCVLLDGVAAGTIAADKVVAGAIALSWIASLVARSDLRDEMLSHTPVYFTLLLLLGAWYTASTVWADDPGEATYQLIRLLPNLLIVPVIVSAVNDARTLRWLIASLLVGVLFSVVYGLAVNPVDPEADGRLSGQGLDANLLALWAVVSATLAYGVLAARIDGAARVLAAAGIGLCGVAVLASGSRTGLLVLGICLLLAPLVLRRGHRVLALFFALVAVAGAGVYFANFASEEVTERVTNFGEDGGSGRTSIWTVGARMVEANPIGGVGGGNYVTSSVHYLLEPGAIADDRYIVDIPKAAHNTYLQVVAETGFVGGLLFVSLLLMSIVYTARAARRFAAAGMRDLEVLACGLLLAYVALAIGMLSISIDTAKPTWLLIALGPLMMKLVRRAGLAGA